MLSCYQSRRVLEARARGQTRLDTSFDLGKTTEFVALDDVGICAPIRLSYTHLEQIAAVDSVCFAVDHGEPTPLRVFSEAAQRSFQLWPTETSPALLVSGFLMHRIRDVAPHEGAARMVRALGKLHGSLLDTTTGLGYAAIFAAQHASGVTTVEVQPAVRELARQNPWSAELFDNPKIQLTDGDSSEVVPALEPASFSAIIHDPPAINLAGELYSGAFYAALHRALARRGKLFHYVGDPDSPSGARTIKGVVKRLSEAGFARVTIVREAFGVLANA